MAWLQPQPTRERPDTFKQTVLVETSEILARTGQTIHLSQKILQGDIVEHGVGQHPLQLGVLLLKRLQPLGLADVHAAVLGFPFVDAGVTDPVLAAQFGNRDAALVLLQDADDLLFAETTALHVLALSMGQNELQIERDTWGNANDASGSTNLLGRVCLRWPDASRPVNKNNNIIPTCRQETYRPIDRGANYSQAGFNPEGPNNP